jgi:putative hydroxymethylpyrimidine transport system substrate-binding protein
VTRRHSALVILAMLTVTLAACGSDDKGGGGGGKAGTPVPAPVDGLSVGKSRCAKNRAAGTITYLTGFQDAASPSIIDVVAADERHYFEALCLSVKVQTGQSGGQNEQFVGAGRAQLAGSGGPGDVMKAAAAGAKIRSIATYGNTNIVVVIVRGDGPIRTPKDLEGHTFGYKGAPPPGYLAMLAKAGVDRSKIKEVEVGFDPSVLRTQVDALAGYLSNEPGALERSGFKVRVLNPVDYGATTSFNSIIVNDNFGKDHPTAVADFMRATLLGFRWVDAHLDDAIAIATKRSEGTYNAEAERFRWQTESKLVNDHLFPGHGLLGGVPRSRFSSRRPIPTGPGDRRRRRGRRPRARSRGRALPTC